WKAFQQNRLRERLKSAAAGTLDGPRDQDHAQTGCRSAHEGRHRENHDASDQKSFAPEAKGKPSARWKDNRVCDEVAGEHPCRFIVSRRQTAGNVRQGNGRDGSVEHFHERCQHDGDGDQPRIDPRRSRSILRRWRSHPFSRAWRSEKETLQMRTWRVRLIYFDHRDFVATSLSRYGAET